MSQEVIWSQMTPCMGLSWSRIGCQGQKNQIWSHGAKKKLAQKFLYTKLVRYHEVILCGFEAKIVFGAKQASNIHQLRKKIKLILRHQKVVYVNRQVKRKLLKLFWGQKMIPMGLLGALTDPQVSPGTQKGLETLKLVQFLCYR